MNKYLPVSILIVVVLALACVGPVEADEEGWIKFADPRGMVIFDAAVNGEPTKVLLDSGAELNIMSAAFAERAGIRARRGAPIRIIGAFGQEIAQLSRLFQLEIEGQLFPFRDVPIVSGTGFDLVIGQRLFESLVVQIDYPNRRFRLLPQDAVAFEGNVNVRRREGALLAEASIGGRRAWLQIDTGNSGNCLLKRRFVTRTGLDAYQVESARQVSRGAVSSGETQLLQLENVQLGPYTFETLLADYIPEDNEGFDSRISRTGSLLREDTMTGDGLLGYEALRPFVVTMDLKGRKLHLYMP